MKFHRTHSIRELAGTLAAWNVTIEISEEEMDLLDTIYVPSKYPEYSMLPHAQPNEAVCNEALRAAGKVGDQAHEILQGE